jgi:hypothetical protein
MNWDTIVRHYGVRRRTRKDDELDWFRRQPSLEDAVIIAARAVNERCKRFRHQTRITRAALSEAEKIMVDDCDALGNCCSFHNCDCTSRKLLLRLSA